MGGSSASASTSQRADPAADRFAGVRAMAPVTVAYVPFGLLVGSAVGASANPLAAWLATMTIYGGAAHLAVLAVLAQGSGWPAAAAVGLLVNARLIAYATAMAPQWRSAPLHHRVVAALMLTDAPWALSRGRAQDQRRFYLGAALTLFIAWPLLVTLGAMASGWLGGAPLLGLLPAVTLGAAVVQQMHQRPAVAAVAAGACCAVLTAAWPAGVSLAVSGAVGAVAGLVSVRVR